MFCFILTNLRRKNCFYFKYKLNKETAFDLITVINIDKPYLDLELTPLSTKIMWQSFL